MSETFDKVKAIFEESRNGANAFFRHGLARKLVYTDGVQEVAEVAGAYWLLDVIGTEFTPALLGQFETGYGLATITFTVRDDDTAVIEMRGDEAEPPIYERTIPFTDFPFGVWTFYLGVDGSETEGFHTTLILPSEY